MSSVVHKRAHKAPLLLSRKFLDEAITGEEIGAGPRCKATARGNERGRREVKEDGRGKSEGRNVRGSEKLRGGG